MVECIIKKNRKVLKTVQWEVFFSAHPALQVPDSAPQTDTLNICISL